MKTLKSLLAVIAIVSFSGLAMAADTATNTDDTFSPLAAAKATGCVYVEGPMFLEFAPDERYFDASSEIVLEIAALKEQGFDIVSAERFTTPDGPYYGAMVCISQPAP